MKIGKYRFLRSIHTIVLKILVTKRKFDLVVEGNIPDCQCIFIANHYCIHDIPTAGEIINKHCIILVSDEDKKTLSGVALELNGVVWINRLSKASRQEAFQKMLKLLNNGYNILMYPEATWNLTAELPMLPMNWGVVSLSLSSNVPIVPIYLLFDDKTCYAKIGDLFFPSDDKIVSIQNLRDAMSTLCWSLMEKYSLDMRSSITDDYLSESIRKRYEEYERARKDPEGVRNYEKQFIFKPKGQCTFEEAFAHLATLEPNLNNAFLFNKRLK